MVFHDKYNACSDEELIDKFIAEDNSVFVGILYQRYGHLVLGLCIKYLKNKVEAQDATVQIFSKLLTDLKKHKVTFFKSWLFVFSKNFCLMELRKRQSLLKKELELKDNLHLVMDSEEDLHLNEKEKQFVLLETAIGMLNPDQRTCIELFYLQRKSYTEISEITGQNANEVKSNIQNGKRNLKIKMEGLMNEQA